MHTAWNARDGAPRIIQAITQTTDGFLWLGTADGLYRFDGVTFERFDDQDALPSTHFTTLFAEANGDLWFSYGTGHISLLRSGKVRDYSARDGLPNSLISGLVRDRAGVLWAATSGGLMYLAEDRWRPVEASRLFPGKAASAIATDREGTLWIATENQVVRLPAGARTFQLTGASIGQALGLAQAADGQMWMAETTRSVRPVLPDQEAAAPGTAEIKAGSVSIFFDKTGSLWITTLGDGLLRAVSPDALSGKLDKSSTVLDPFTEADGLTDNFVQSIFQDREGNIWVGTKNGLDRFREGTLLPGIWPFIGKSIGVALTPGTSGDMWVDAKGHLAHVQGAKLEQFGKDFDTISPGYCDRAGVIWWPGIYNVAHIEKGQLSFLPLPQGFAKPFLGRMYLIGDNSGHVWLDAGTKGLFYWKADTWQSFEPAKLMGLGSPGAVFRDETGTIWFGQSDGRLITLKGDVLQNVSSIREAGVGGIQAIQGKGEHLWIGGTHGLAVRVDGKFLPIIPSDRPAFQSVSGVVESADGDVWLAEKRGVIHIRREEVQQSIQNPLRPVDYEIFDHSDGVPGRFLGYVASREVEGSDGRIWFSGSDGVAWLDSSHIHRKTLPPPVVIRSVQADRHLFNAESGLYLPALISELQITYAGLSLSAPERVRFRYQLQGVDHEWQDAGGRRDAFYTKLGPGKYTFRVIACNNDGVWNKEGATLIFSVAPAWFQTVSFRALCITLALVCAYMTYRLRVRQIARAMSDRFNERLAERTRLAQELHDTFLQTVQGSQLVTVDALAHTQDAERTRLALEQISEFLTQATTEGRAALQALRSSSTETNDLAAALRRALEDCRRERSMETNLTVKGDSSEVHPLVRDEIYRIGYEAVRNACVHSEAAHVNVVLSYGSDLRLQVRDDGLGIAPDLLESGRPDHFGLQGMRERADRIGARFTISSKTGSGTEVELIVPGDLAFRSHRKRHN